MPLISENKPLKKLNTFGVDASARWFTEIKSINDLSDLFSNPAWKSINKLIIGGGSNILFTKDFDGLVIRMNIKGIEVKVEGDNIYITAGAGEVWNDLVNYCVDRDFGGIENLSLIPGSVGASPIQNIGAYGVELKDVFHSCKAFEIESGKELSFSNSDCQFGYRESIFKKELKERVIITSVTYKLSAKPDINTSYGAISSELKNRGIENPTIKDISKVVSDIRVSKLPDPSTIGNAGSFFKNPVVSKDILEKILSSFPNTVHYCLPNSTVKLAAGWLIEQCGWKGKKMGDTGTWKNQALVLVNHGNAKGSDIYKLSSAIINDVENKFGIRLEREVNLI